MKIILLTVICFIQILADNAVAQTPDWFIAEINRLEGTWLADNSEYISEQETDDTYGLEWKKGTGGNSLLGELFGMKDGIKTGSYWQFFQYWDPAENKVIVTQVSPWGTVGKGSLIMETDTKSKLDQLFTNPDGSSYRSGHITESFDGYEVGSSYNINDSGEWEIQRTYKWVKQ